MFFGLTLNIGQVYYPAWPPILSDHCASVRLVEFDLLVLKIAGVLR